MVRCKERNKEGGHSMLALTKRMVVISFDCLSAADFSIFHTLPNFQRVFKNGSYARQVETIYPSLTYPCHASIVTGNYPNRHRIINNTLLQPNMLSPDWNWYRRAIAGTTIYDEAQKADLTTAALLWPVTGRAKGIRYNLPEIFPNRPWQSQLLVSLFSGTPSYQWELNKLFGHIRKGLTQPALDDFVLESAVHTIKTKRPNLTLVHFTDLDTMRHHYGATSVEANNAIHRHDQRLGRILDALEESGEYEETTVVVLGDHAALDVSNAVSVNVLLRENDLIDVNSNGKITDWRAFCKSCDGSAYIYLKDKTDEKTRASVEKILTELVKDVSKGIEKVLTGEEADKRGADQTCAFMLEAASGFYFIDDHDGDYIRQVTLENRAHTHNFMLGSHGYSPEKEDYSTFFLLSGKGVRKNEIIPFMRLVDIGPTLARLLGLSLGQTDGKMIEQFIEH